MLSAIIPQLGLIGLFSFDYTSFTGKYTVPCLAPVLGLGKYLVESYAMPAALCISLLLCFCVDYLRHKRLGKRFDPSQYYQALWQTILLTYTSVNVSGLSLVLCKQVGPWSLMQMNDSVQCSGKGYFFALVVGCLLAGIISIVLPVFIIWSHKRRRLVKWFVGKMVVPLAVPAPVQSKADGPIRLSSEHSSDSVPVSEHSGSSASLSSGLALISSPAPVKRKSLSKSTAAVQEDSGCSLILSNLPASTASVMDSLSATNSNGSSSTARSTTNIVLLGNLRRGNSNTSFTFRLSADDVHNVVKKRKSLRETMPGGSVRVKSRPKGVKVVPLPPRHPKPALATEFLRAVQEEQTAPDIAPEVAFVDGVPMIGVVEDSPPTGPAGVLSSLCWYHLPLPLCRRILYSQLHFNFRSPSLGSVKL